MTSTVPELQEKLDKEAVDAVCLSCQRVTELYEIAYMVSS